ncbi:protein NRT1/ PTR FAMILY 5.10-like [Iris pallida]|uniref:Protein NRT1/ PTR FAMILY 5.10-like n=1 Tax=Iris pallida TaxID=29817 RepID=A0AAX6FA47_IRIPA|nr:protein NRT1/ PTR FAMILY 5.10-like [Iris pallida]
MANIVNFRGLPINRSVTTGRWSAALFIIGVEIAERAAYYGIALNLITYLTGHLHESTASAAASVNTWSGVASLMPLLGAFVAESYLGRYRTIVVSSVVYVLGLGLLTLSSVLRTLSARSRIAFFYLSLYLVAFAQGGHKPCVQAFGADQFDENDPEESAARSSFFNWWYFGLTAGTVASVVVLSYVQDNVGWGLGFGVPCVLMAVALVAFLAGTRTYRYHLLEDESPFSRIGKTFLVMARGWLASRRNKNRGDSATPEGAGRGQDQAAADQSNNIKEDGHEPSPQQIEEARGVLRLFPIWTTCLIYAVVFAQSSTFFTKQGSTMDRRIGSSFRVPPAALQSFIGVSILVLVPVYDRVLVPAARKYLSKSSPPSGITPLQRVGTGMLVSTLAVAAAALVERKRLRTARDCGLVDLPGATVPMSLWWLVPQYVLYGAADVFTMVGLQEFFYDQVPDTLRSLGLAFYLSIFGVGSFVSGLLVSVVDRATGKSTGQSWLSSNLNRGHLDYFYWLLAGLSALEFVIYLFLARAYVYKIKGSGAI